MASQSVGVFAGSKGLGVEYSKKLGTVPNGVIKFSISGLSGVQFCLDDNGVVMIVMLHFLILEELSIIIHVIMVFFECWRVL